MSIKQTIEKMMLTTPRKKRKNISKMLVTIPNTSGAKQTKVFGTEEPGNTENTKEEDSENSKGKLKDISNTDKETYG